MSFSKRYLITPDEYHLLKGKQNNPDLAVIKFNENFVKNSNSKKIQETEEWNQLSQRVKPLFNPVSTDDIQIIVSDFSKKKRDHAMTILKLIKKIPNVIVTQNHIFHNGKPLNGSVYDIVNDLIKSNAFDESLILKSFDQNANLQSPTKISARSEKMRLPSPIKPQTLTSDFPSKDRKMSPRIDPLLSPFSPSKDSTPSKTPTPSKGPKASPRTPGWLEKKRKAVEAQLVLEPEKEDYKNDFSSNPFAKRDLIKHSPNVVKSKKSKHGTSGWIEF